MLLKLYFETVEEPGRNDPCKLVKNIFYFYVVFWPNLLYSSKRGDDNNNGLPTLDIVNYYFCFLGGCVSPVLHHCAAL